MTNTTKASAKPVHTANFFRVEEGEFNNAYWVVNFYFKGKLYTRRRVKDEEAARARVEEWTNWDRTQVK